MFRRISAAAAAMLLLAACGGSGSPQASPATATSAAPPTSSESPKPVIQVSGASAGSAGAAPAASKPAASAVPSAPVSASAAPALKPEDLLAAALSPADIQQLFPADQAWWPKFGEIYAPPFDYGDRAPGERFYIANNYLKPDKPDGELDVALILYDTSESASAAMAGLLKQSNEGAGALQGPVIADEQRYFTHTSPPKDNPTPSETTARFRVGPVVGRVTKMAPSGFEQTDAMARYAAPVVSKIKALLAGQLKAQPVPDTLANALPPATGGVSPVLGTAVVGPEAWALIDDANDPRSVDSQLVSGGVTALGYRYFALTSKSDQLVQAILFPFKDAAKAATWAAAFCDRSCRQKPLDTGKIGAAGVYAPPTPRSGSYQLAFAADRNAVTVACFSPFGKVAAACEATVRQLGEAWFAALGGKSTAALPTPKAPTMYR